MTYLIFDLDVMLASAWKEFRTERLQFIQWWTKQHRRQQQQCSVCTAVGEADHHRY